MAIRLATRRDLTLEACHRVAWRGEAVVFDPAAIAAMAEARARFRKLRDEPGITIYGVTSGYGQNARKRLAAAERMAHARMPPVAATASWGDPLPERAVRAIAFARLANFVEGHAGISPEIAVAAARMLDGGPLPVVPTRGQGGAGEIMSLSHLFVDLARAHEVGEKDVLSLINGSPAATGLAADAALAARRRCDLAARVFAFAAEALNVPFSHFAAELAQFWNNPYDAWALGRLRELIDGGCGGDRRPYQAPVSFRIMPRMLGQAWRAALFAEEVARESLMAVTDNPVLLPASAEHPNGQAISTGGFHNPYCPMALDLVTAAYANLATVAERMAAKLLDGAVSLLPPQLGAEAGLSYLGCLPMALAGYQYEMRMLAQPSLLPGSESGGFGQNDIASPVFPAWSKQERAGALLEQCLATLAAVAARAFTVTERDPPSGLAALLYDVAFAIPDLDAHEPIGPQIARLAEHCREAIYDS